MSVNTRDKRFALMTLGQATAFPWPAPDNSLDASDRMEILGAYYLTVAAAYEVMQFVANLALTAFNVELPRSSVDAELPLNTIDAEL